LDVQWDGWLRQLDKAARAASGSGDALALRETPPDSPEEIHYILRRQSGRLKLELAVVRRLKAGGYGQPRNFALGNVLYNQPPAPRWGRDWPTRSPARGWPRRSSRRIRRPRFPPNSSNTPAHWDCPRRSRSRSKTFRM